MICYRLTITGKVQGVFYRASAQRMARNLGVNGWVRNEIDGTVTLEVEGAEDKVSEMVEWCKNGPFHARVKDVTHDESAIQAYQSFQIR